jgi:hypothetical protein
MVVRLSAGAVEQVRAHRTRFAWRIIADFAALLALDNVTMDLPALRRNAAAVAEAFAAIGARMEVIEHAGAAPIVVGRLGANSELPILGVYVHYDGQPIGTGGWRTPPFEPTLCRSDGRVVPLPREGDPIGEDWRLFAPTLRLCVTGCGRMPGSSATDLYTNRRRRRSSRGYCGFDLTVYGPSHEIHSGHYGNWARGWSTARRCGAPYQGSGAPPCLRLGVRRPARWRLSPRPRSRVGPRGRARWQG